MNTNAREMYINVLEKRAAEALAPDYGVDSQAVANAEVASNNSDQRTQISGLLNAAKATETATTKQVGQPLPIAKKTTGTTASNPLLKVAMHEAFFAGVRQTELFKTAELEYLRTAFEGFEDEMGKVANVAKFTKAMGGAKTTVQNVLKGGPTAKTVAQRAPSPVPSLTSRPTSIDGVRLKFADAP